MMWQNFPGMNSDVYTTQYTHFRDALCSGAPPSSWRYWSRSGIKSPLLTEYDRDTVTYTYLTSTSHGDDVVFLIRDSRNVGKLSVQQWIPALSLSPSAPGFEARSSHTVNNKQLQQNPTIHMQLSLASQVSVSRSIRNLSLFFLLLPSMPQNNNSDLQV